MASPIKDKNPRRLKYGSDVQAGDSADFARLGGVFHRDKTVYNRKQTDNSEAAFEDASSNESKITIKADYLAADGDFIDLFCYGITTVNNGGWQFRARFNNETSGTVLFESSSGGDPADEFWIKLRIIRLAVDSLVILSEGIAKNASGSAAGIKSDINEISHDLDTAGDFNIFFTQVSATSQAVDTAKIKFKMGEVK